MFYNTLSVNLASVDDFTKTNTSHVVDNKTQLPHLDYWNYMRENYATTPAKAGVHRTKEGSNGVNGL